MSVGSAFDAFAKSYLHEKLFGKGADPKYELRTLFEEQVEKQHWDWAWENGKEAMRMYRESGALVDLLIELHKAVGDPVFEVSLEGKVQVQKEGVPNTAVNLLGKPDVYFINGQGNPVIIDWKVNGWCSRNGHSPKKGFMRVRHGSKNRGLDKDHHKDCIPMMVQGMMINAGHNLEDIDKNWATQLSIYAWLCGSDVGSDFVTGIDQLACSPASPYPEVRVAQHRLLVGKTYQWEVFLKAQEVWDIIHSDHVFRDRTLKESQNLCEALDAKAKTLVTLSESDDPMDQAFMSMSK